MQTRGMSKRAAATKTATKNPGPTKKAKKKEVSSESSEEETPKKTTATSPLPKVGTPKEDTPESLAGEKTLTDLLGLDPTKFTKVSDYQAEFDRIANELMNSFTLEINHTSYRLAELEFYLNDENHPDIFTHGDEMQKTSGQWYFHRVGKGYKGGSYKGLDITFSTRGFGGILIRAIKRIEDDTFIEGPCMVVNTILEACGAKEIADFVATPGFNLSVGKKSSLYLRPSKDLKPLTALTSGRFGLVLRNDDQAKFVLKPYRYMLYPLEVRKGRQHLVLELHYSKKTTKEISTLTGCGAAQISKWTTEYDKAVGGKLTAESFYAKKNSAGEFCAFYQVLKVVNDK